MLYTIVDKFLMNDFTNLIVDHLNKKNEDKTTIFDIGYFQGNFSRKLKKELKTKKNNFHNVYSEIRSYLENEFNYRIIIEKNIWFLSKLSGMRAKDVLFVKNNK